MTIIHIVLFEFKADLDPDKVKDACNRMLDLREECIHPTSNKPYIKTSSGGKDNSPEGHQGGLTHGFVVEFENEGDRDYYVAKDPAHQKFIAFAGPMLQQVKVIDYEPGRF